MIKSCRNLNIYILISAANHQRQGLLYPYFKEVHKSQDPRSGIIFLYLVLTTSLYFSGLTQRTFSRLTIFHQPSNTLCSTSQSNFENPLFKIGCTILISGIEFQLPTLVLTKFWRKCVARWFIRKELSIHFHHNIWKVDDALKVVRTILANWIAF